MEATDSMPDPINLLILLGILSLLPILIMMGTAFVKISVVMSLLRNAMGIQQIPPNIAMHGIALVLTGFIMAPVGLEAYEILQRENVSFSDPNALQILTGPALNPYREFLVKHTPEATVATFKTMAEDLWAKDHHVNITDDNLMILLPAFTVGQLLEAFEIGFLIYLPFLVIDLLVSNVLLAMGMMMVSPMTISLPFKLLLFVFIDGWSRLIEALVLSYQ